MVIRWSCWKLWNASEEIAIVEEETITKNIKAHHIGYLGKQEAQWTKGYYTRAGSLRIVWIVRPLRSARQKTADPTDQLSFGLLKSLSLIFGFGAGSATGLTTCCCCDGGGGLAAGVAVVDRLPFDLPNLSFRRGASWPGVSRFATAICPGACHFGGIGFILTLSVRRKRRWP